MSHFAKINSSNIVTDILVSEKDFINSGLVGDEFLWVQTSYNGNFRKNFAGVGMAYDSVRDAFIFEKPYPSWVLDEATCSWEAPTLCPTGYDIPHRWDEATTSWVLDSTH